MLLGIAEVLTYRSIGLPLRLTQLSVVHHLWREAMKRCFITQIAAPCPKGHLSLSIMHTYLILASHQDPLWLIKDELISFRLSISPSPPPCRPPTAAHLVHA